jgi:mono/diheme cytochrome c family protein
MRSVIATLAAVVVLVALSAAGFVYSGAYYVGADQPHWPVTTWLLNEVRDRSVRAQASGITAPDGLDDPAKIVAGVTHYAEHCAGCHGAPGVERGDLAEGLYPRPPNLADAARLYTPGELFWIVKHGIRMTGMPAWGDHSDDELWATVALIEKLPGMTDQDYAKLVAASRGQGGHHDSQEAPPGPASRPVEKAADDPARKHHDHSAGHHH